MKEMINVALRSEFTFKQVYQKIEEMPEGQHTALGIADLNNTQGHVRFRNACMKAGIKPIYGVRVMAVYNVEEQTPNPGQWGHVYIVLAKTQEGLAEIYRLVRTAFDNFRYRPMVSLVDIWSLSENVIVIAENFDIPERIDYIGLSQVTNRALIKAHKIPTVAINHNYYPKATDRESWELLMGARFMDQKTFQQHILSTQEWFRLFGDRKAIKNTYEIAEACNVELRKADPVRYSGDETLRGLVDEGIKRRKYPLTKQAKKRLKIELELIEEKDYTDYFLVVAQMTTEAKKKFLVGPGRGSAGGSLVCYLLGITDVDPLPFGLLFERFLDRNRFDMPDIDIDFPDVARQEVIRGLKRDNGGEDHVCHLGTVARQRGDSLINHFGAELNIPFEDTAMLKEILIRRPGGDLRVNYCVHDTVTTTEMGKRFAKRYPAILQAAKYEGHATHFGTHAAGILVCNEPVTNFVGVNSRENAAMIDYREAEELNLLKIDVLGLQTLAMLQECADLAGFDFHDYYDVDLEDEKALEVFRSGRLTGVFQFEGHALRGLCRQLQVRKFDEISALTALARPGPLHGGGTEKYILRQTGKEEVSFTSKHPAFHDNTQETYGVIVYQEQLMHICRAVGMSWEDTSAFRRVVAKRKGPELLGTFEKRFKKAAKKTGMKKEDRNAVWKEMVTFGSYGFNKSHAVAYAMISQWCAWAKAHYPLEFAVAGLNNCKSQEAAVLLLREIVRHDKIPYIPVDPDTSDIKWTVQDGVLVGGLTNIKGIAESKAKTIIRNRKTGKVNPDGILRLLVNPETPFDILFPCEEFWSDYYENPQAYGLNEPVSYICDIQEKDNYTFIGQLIDKKVKDLNTEEQIAKRNGEVYDENTVCLNLTFRDDTDEIQCRIPRGKFDEFAHEIIERDDYKDHDEVHWYIVKGTIISDEIRFIFINKIHFLGEEH